MSWKCNKCKTVQSEKTEPAEIVQPISLPGLNNGVAKLNEYRHCRPCVDAAKARREARRKERANQKKLNA
jgi:hypothetical protein